jgi:hypothetical protein
MGARRKNEMTMELDKIHQKSIDFLVNLQAAP